MTNNKLTNEQLRERADRKVKSLKAAIGQSAFTNIRRDLEEELQLAEYALAGMKQEPRSKAAVATLKHHGFTWQGGELWKPPLGLPPAFASNDRAELQEYRKAKGEPIYQYRIRNGYNGQVTEWQTIRRDQVDFVLKSQPVNAEFQIIAAPTVEAVPVVSDGYLGVK